MSDHITSTDNGPVDATTALYRAAIGVVNTTHYARIFTAFESQDRVGIRWNWAAALCTLNWLAYRRLWSAALMYAGCGVGVALLVFGIGRLVFQFSDLLELGLVFGFSILTIVVPGLLGNAIFYKRCREKMAHALAVNATLDDACAMLQRHASSRLRLIILASANAGVIALVASGYALFPSAGNLPPLVQKPTEPSNVAVGVVSPAPVPTVVTAPPVAIQAAPKLEPVPSPVPAPVAAPVPVQLPIAETKSEPPPALLPAPAPPILVPKREPPKPPKAITPQPQPKASAAAVIEGRFYLNVGLFADDNNARNAHVKLMDAGLPSAQLELDTPKGKRTRVRVGPYDSLGDADSAAKKIRNLGLEAVLVRP